MTISSNSSVSKDSVASKNLTSSQRSKDYLLRLIFQPNAIVLKTSPIYREIGTGSIGKVFVEPGTILAYKLPLTDVREKLWNNYVMHTKIAEAFDIVPVVPYQVRVPKCYFFESSASNDFWNAHLNRFPELPGFSRKARDALAMERIFPLPRCIREALIDRFCPETFQDAARANGANKDCLIRPYFGRYGHGSSTLGFTLRNFKLHIDQIGELGVDVVTLYSTIAHAFAVLHWAVETDGNGLEFVFGRRPLAPATARRGPSAEELQRMSLGTSTRSMTMREDLNFHQCNISLWMVDFDKCTEITMDKAGVEKAVKVFMETDPYWPRPNSSVESVRKLWPKFKEQYLSHSQAILEFKNKRKFSHLPIDFISHVEAFPRLE